MTFTLRHLPNPALQQLAQIDVSEEVNFSYTFEQGELRPRCISSYRPPWTASDWQQHLDEWVSTLKPDLWIGAFAGERLAGVASLRYRLPGMPSETMAQLTTLHVDRAHRRQGIAQALLQEITRLAKETKAESIYVSATESESAVGFYLRQGFQPTEQPHPELFALEPGDIHMICPL